MHKYKYGVLLEYFNIILTNITGLLITPYIVHSLGGAEYGLYALVGSLVAYLSLMDFGLHNSVVRFVSKYRVENSTPKIYDFMGTVMVMYSLIALIIFLVGAIIYSNIDTIFGHSLDGDELGKLKLMFLILIFNVALVLPSGALKASCTAYEQFVFPKIINIFKIILRVSLILTLLMYWQAAVLLVLIDTSLNIVIAIVLYIYTKKKLGLKYNFSNLSVQALKSVTKYSFWMFIAGIAAYLQWQAGLFTIGLKLSTTQVAIYSIGIMLGSYLGAFAGAFNTLLLPKANKYISENANPHTLTTAMISVARFNNALSFLVVSGFFLFGQDFIKLWLGDDFKDAWYICILFMAVLIIPLSQSFGMSILESQGRIRFRAITNFSILSASIICGYFLIESYGIISMAIIICAAMFICNVLINWYFIKCFDFNIIRFFRKSLLPFIPITGLLVITVCYSQSIFHIEKNWLILALYCVLYSLLYLVFTYKFVCTPQERSMLFKKRNKQQIHE